MTVNEHMKKAGTDWFPLFCFTLPPHPRLSPSRTGPPQGERVDWACYESSPAAKVISSLKDLIR